MNALIVATVLGVGALMALGKGNPGGMKLDVGKRYIAAFQPPSSVTSDMLIHLRDILPPGSEITVSENPERINVAFTSVSSLPIGDIPSPVGTFKLISLKSVD